MIKVKFQLLNLVHKIKCNYINTFIMQTIEIKLFSVCLEIETVCPIYPSNSRNNKQTSK